MLEQLKRIILITGHYGSGKTNLAVNLALDLRQSGRDVVLCDLDLVNPYFRSADFEALMHERGIATISPTFAGTNLDTPVVGPGLSAVVGQREKTVIVDVGGDDAGAVALGRYAGDITARGYSMICVYNHYRYLTSEAAGAQEVLDAIHAVSRLRATHIVNNSNLGEETDGAALEASEAPCRELCALTGLPLLFTTVPRRLQDKLPERFSPQSGFYPVDIYVRPPWEK